jgi:hypothetical protein
MMLDARDFAGAVAAIVANPLDVDAIIGSLAADLEINMPANVGADISGKAFDSAIVP